MGKDENHQQILELNGIDMGLMDFPMDSWDWDELHLSVELQRVKQVMT